jgi:ubiquinone biosynthesis O-methyltransferase
MKNNNEIEFKKYKTRGAYHWEQIGLHPIKRNAFVLGRYRNVIFLLRKKLGFLKAKKILDVGCGDGVLSYMLAKEHATVSGVDTSDIAIAYAKEKTKNMQIDFRQVSAYELPFDEGEFDAVVSSDVIEHLQDVNQYIKEIKRVTKKGGAIVLSTPIRFTEKPLDKMHVIEWFEEEYMNIIIKYFEKTDFYRSHPVFWMEAMQRSKYGRLIVNIISYFKNPFEEINPKFRYMALQYSISENNK